jgi:NitT/TauT family transport system ATP-binding protein
MMRLQKSEADIRGGNRERLLRVPSLLRVADAGKIYPGGTEALRGANLTIDAGEFVCLIGTSGCGKSTLLRMIGGFEMPTSGEVVMAGKPVSGPGPDRGMVFQDYGLFPWLTVHGNIAFGPLARGKSKAEAMAIADRFVTMMGLDRFAKSFPHQLSGGMKQRVSIGRVLANDARLALMDEPFGALDAMTRERLQEELLEIWRSTGLSVVFVTHSLEEAIFLADRIVVMSPGPGRIVAEERITLERPRDVSSPEFNDIRRRLHVMLHGTPTGEHAPAGVTAPEVA